MSDRMPTLGAKIRVVLPFFSSDETVEIEGTVSSLDTSYGKGYILLKAATTYHLPAPGSDAKIRFRKEILPKPVKISEMSVNWYEMEEMS